MAGNNTRDKHHTAPSPDDPRKPDTPGEVTKPSWKYVLRKTLREFSADQCTDIAAALTYYAVLSLFPALIALISLLGVVGQGERSVNTHPRPRGPSRPPAARPMCCATRSSSSVRRRPPGSPWSSACCWRSGRHPATSPRSAAP